MYVIHIHTFIALHMTCPAQHAVRESWKNRAVKATMALHHFGITSIFCPTSVQLGKQNKTLILTCNAYNSAEELYYHRVFTGQ